MAYRTVGKASPRSGGQRQEKPMTQKSFLRFLGFQSDNLKPKIQNRKLVALVTLAVAFVLCGAVAHAQQAEKIFRIGFLDASTASGIAVLLDAFRQELRKLGWIEGKNITINPPEAGEGSIAKNAAQQRHAVDSSARRR